MKLRAPATLAIVVPCYNEGDGLQWTTDELLSQLSEMTEEKLITKKSFICFVDDGSKDTTWQELVLLHNKYPSQVLCIKLTKNVGHQNAMLAGLEYCSDRADCTISIDADLQQDRQKMSDFIKEYQKGAEIVYGIRVDRSDDTLFKKMTAQLYYQTMRFFGAESIPHHADYRLVSSKALRALGSYGERNLYLRGLFLQLGYKTAKVSYHHGPRRFGATKYGLRKMMRLAINGITSFSIRPLRIISIIGLSIFVASFIIIFGILVLYIFDHGSLIPGWVSTVLPMYFLGGLQLLSLGIIGEYIGNIYTETKHRPRYIIEEVVDD